MEGRQAVSLAMLRALALAVGLSALAALIAAPAVAIEAPAGSKNFTTPRNVPDYFSNESGPFHSASPRAAVSPAQPSLATPAPAPARMAAAPPRYSRRVAYAAPAIDHARYRRAHARGRFARHAVHHGKPLHLRAARHGRPTALRVAHAHRAPPHKRAAAQVRQRPHAAKTRRVARAGR